MDEIKLNPPASAIHGEWLVNLSVNIKTIGRAKTEVNKMPAMKNPNSTAGPDFWDENKLPSSEQLAAIIIGSGLSNISGTRVKNKKSVYNYIGLHIKSEA